MSLKKVLNTFSEIIKIYQNILYNLNLNDYFKTFLNHEKENK